MDAGAWNVDLRRRLNDWEIGEMINLLGFVDPIQLNMSMEDCMCWSFSKSEIFSAKSWREANRAREERDPI